MNENALSKKIEKERKREAKNEFGMDIINASDAGEKRSSRELEGADDDIENDSGPPTQSTNTSVAYKKENKVPVEHPAAATRKKKE